MTYRPSNIFKDIPDASKTECITPLLTRSNLRFERIVSLGQSSPDEYWYDQHQHEWVILIQGNAVLRFEDDEEPYQMSAGDYIEIPAHCRHRVEWTDPDTETIWLAVHFDM